MEAKVMSQKFYEDFMRFKTYVEDPGKAYMVIPMTKKYFKEEESFKLKSIMYLHKDKNLIFNVGKTGELLNMEVILYMIKLLEGEEAVLYVKDIREPLKIKNFYIRATEDKKKGILFVRFENNETMQIVFRV